LSFVIAKKKKKRRRSFAHGTVIVFLFSKRRSSGIIRFAGNTLQSALLFHCELYAISGGGEVEEGWRVG